MKIWTRCKEWLSRKKSSKLLWRNLHLTGASDCRSAILCYAGLAANGAISQKKIARELYRRFDRRMEFWQRNLWGHTGLYGHFRESRMWNWTLDGFWALRKLLRRPNNDQVFIIGHSTGALVAVVLAWLFERFPILFGRKSRRAELGGIVLNAPAFVLRNKRNTALLLMVLLIYYLLCPIMFVAILLIHPDLWDLTLIVALCFYLLLPRVRVPTGPPEAHCGLQPKLKDRMLCKAREYRALSLVIHIGIAPILLLLAAFLFPINWVRAALWLYLGTLLAALLYLPKREVLEADWEEDEVEDSRSDRYRWLPVITAATLLPLQWAASRLVPKLRCPILFVLAEKDRVVDNSASEKLGSKLTSDDVTIKVIAKAHHSNRDEEVQLRFADCMEAWLSDRISEKDLYCKEVQTIQNVIAQRAEADSGTDGIPA